MNCKIVIYSAVTLLMSACSPYPEVTSEQAQALLPITEQVSEERLMNQVAALMASHDQDTPLD